MIYFIQNVKRIKRLNEINSHIENIKSKYFSDHKSLCTPLNISIKKVFQDKIEKQERDLVKSSSSEDFGHLPDKIESKNCFKRQLSFGSEDNRKFFGSNQGRKLSTSCSGSYEESYFDEDISKRVAPQEKINKSELKVIELPNSHIDEDRIRNKFFLKLITEKIWRKNSDHNSIVILDWDDTLLCTTFLAPNGFYDERIILNSKQEEQIKILEDNVFALLSECLVSSDTYIVTNAAPGWVQYSCLKYYPKVHDLLARISVFSARELFEKIHAGNMRKWKIETFQLIINKYRKNILTNIICIGDSFIEMEAGHLMAGEFEKALIKSIKFKEGPKIEELIKQLKLVNKQFSTIYKSTKSLKVTVEKKNKD